MLSCGLAHRVACRYIDFSNNMLSGTVPLAISTLALASVRLSGNQLSGTLPPAVAAVFPANGTVWSTTCISNATSQYLGCSLQERPALVELYTATIYSPSGWNVSTGWLSSSHPCSWSGVTCTGQSAVM